MKLIRPNIPHSVRVEVALRQLRETGAIECALIRTESRVGPYLKRLLFMLQLRLDTMKILDLHHRPALVNREKVIVAGKHVGYVPDANDPEHLFYVPEDQHDVETRVRGIRGQHSDLALVRKRKNIERNRMPDHAKKGSINPSSRKLRSANRWPPRGSQKIQNRLN